MFAAKEQDGSPGRIAPAAEVQQARALERVMMEAIRKRRCDNPYSDPLREQKNWTFFCYSFIVAKYRISCSNVK
uniref:G protein gamma domain-containing protein n=1 Tax=Steinernema glaseri TaxID=37863 RepID=A0A1I7ZS40_9BILA